VRPQVSFLGVLIGAALVWALPEPAGAQSYPASYPTRPVKIIVPHAPGGAVDVVARILAPALAAGFGHNVVVENRAGASGNIGSEYVANAAPDGHTLLVNASIHVLNRFVFRSLPFDPVADFAPVALLASGPLLLVAGPDGPTSVRALIERAKAKPGALSFAASGLGSAGHFAEELFKRRAGIDMITVPYRGSAPALTDIAGGQVTAMIDPILSALPLAQAGRLRALGVTSRARSPIAPDVPTLDEAGLPGFEAYSWYGVWAPAKTPPAIVAALHAEFSQALQQPAVRAPLIADGFEIIGASPAAFATHITDETARYAKLVEDARLVFE
jgi:tripartite-type tricarboxylate transporter receptor subunit TctC